MISKLSKLIKKATRACQHDCCASLGRTLSLHDCATQLANCKGISRRSMPILCLFPLLASIALPRSCSHCLGGHRQAFWLIHISRRHPQAIMTVICIPLRQWLSTWSAYSHAQHTLIVQEACACPPRTDNNRMTHRAGIHAGASRQRLGREGATVGRRCQERDVVEVGRADRIAGDSCSAMQVMSSSDESIMPPAASSGMAGSSASHGRCNGTPILATLGEGAGASRLLRTSLTCDPMQLVPHKSAAHPPNAHLLNACTRTGSSSLHGTHLPVLLTHLTAVPLGKCRSGYLFQT